MSLTSCREAKPVVEGFHDACFERFETYAQAEAFIEDWKQSFARVYEREIKMALDQGFRPHDMKLSVKDILQEPKTEVERAGVLVGLKKLKMEDGEA